MSLSQSKCTLTLLLGVLGSLIQSCARGFSNRTIRHIVKPDPLLKIKCKKITFSPLKVPSPADQKLDPVQLDEKRPNTKSPKKTGVTLSGHTAASLSVSPSPAKFLQPKQCHSRRSKRRSRDLPT